MLTSYLEEYTTKYLYLLVMSYLSIFIVYGNTTLMLLCTV